MSESNPEVGPRIADAMAAFTSNIEPSIDESWAAIDTRLAGDTRSSRRSASLVGPAAQRLLVAAAIAVVFVAVVTTIVLARRGDDVIGVATTPTTTTTPSPSAAAPGTVRATSIVAVAQADGALVELDLDGHQQRVISHGSDAADNGRFRGKPSIASDGTIYVERTVRSTCDAAYVQAGDVVGEIVAVDPRSGEPTVVVPAGTAPAISPDGTKLAFAALGGERHCGDFRRTWPLMILDLTTHTTMTVPLATGWLVGAIQPAWTSNSSLVVLGQQAEHSCPAGAPPSACAARQYVLVDLGSVSTTVAPVGTAVSATPPSQFEVLQVSATDSFAATTSADPGRFRLIGARVGTDGEVAADAVEVDPAGKDGVARPLFAIPSHAAPPAGSVPSGWRAFGAPVIDALADGSQVLVAAPLGCSVQMDCLEGPLGELYRWDATGARKIADGIVAAAFVTASASGPATDPTRTTSDPATTRPVDSSAPGTTVFTCPPELATIGDPSAPERIAATLPESVRAKYLSLVSSTLSCGGEITFGGNLVNLAGLPDPQDAARFFTAAVLTLQSTPTVTGTTYTWAYEYTAGCWFRVRLDATTPDWQGGTDCTPAPNATTTPTR